MQRLKWVLSRTNIIHTNDKSYQLSNVLVLQRGRIKTNLLWKYHSKNLATEKWMGWGQDFISQANEQNLSQWAGFPASSKTILANIPSFETFQVYTPWNYHSHGKSSILKVFTRKTWDFLWLCQFTGGYLPSFPHQLHRSILSTDRALWPRDLRSKCVWTFATNAANLHSQTTEVSVVSCFILKQIILRNLNIITIGYRWLTSWTVVLIMRSYTK